MSQCLRHLLESTLHKCSALLTAWLRWIGSPFQCRRMSSPNSAPKPIKSKRYSSQFTEEVDYSKAATFQVESNELRDSHGKISPISITTQTGNEDSIWGSPTNDDLSDRITTHSSVRMVRPENRLGYYAMM
jgi:hypothetical protein